MEKILAQAARSLNRYFTSKAIATVPRSPMRWDKGELFPVVDYDPESGKIETQTFDGDLDEVDLETWMGLPLGSGAIGWRCPIG